MSPPDEPMQTAAQTDTGGWKYDAVSIGYHGAVVDGRPMMNRITEVSEMSTQELIATAKAMVAEGKGLLAMDKSTPTCNKRFEKVGIPQTEEARPLTGK
jgi:hypothetical protein